MRKILGKRAGCVICLRVVAAVREPPPIVLSPKEATETSPLARLRDGSAGVRDLIEGARPLSYGRNARLSGGFPMDKRSRLSTAGVLLLGMAFLVGLLGPASGHAALKQGACVAVVTVYNATGHSCSFKEKGSAKMNYGISQADAPFGFVPTYEVGLCVAATNSCVTKFGFSYVPYLLRGDP